MATISITTSAEQDAAAVRYVAEVNASNGPGVAPLTPAQWARSLVLDQLDLLVAKYADRDRLTKAALYQRASTEDRAAIDAILVKYQL